MQTFVPVDLQSTGELTAGLRPARIGYPQLVPRGLQIPEDRKIPPPTTKVTHRVFSFNHRVLTHQLSSFFAQKISF